MTSPLAIPRPLTLDRARWFAADPLRYHVDAVTRTALDASRLSETLRALFGLTAPPKRLESAPVPADVLF